MFKLTKAKFQIVPMNPEENNASYMHGMYGMFQLTCFRVSAPEFATQGVFDRNRRPLEATFEAVATPTTGDNLDHRTFGTLVEFFGMIPKHREGPGCCDYL